MINRKKKEGICFIWSIIVHKHLKIKINFKKIFKKWIISFFLLIFVYFFKLIINQNILIHPADKINCFEHWSNTRNKSWIILESLKKSEKIPTCKHLLFIFLGNWGGGLLWICDTESTTYDEMLFFKSCTSPNALQISSIIIILRMKISTREPKPQVWFVPCICGGFLRTRIRRQCSLQLTIWSLYF